MFILLTKLLHLLVVRSYHLVAAFKTKYLKLTKKNFNVEEKGFESGEKLGKIFEEKVPT